MTKTQVRMTHAKRTAQAAAAQPDLKKEKLGTKTFLPVDFRPSK
jgi:hypothetical protein